MISPTQSQSQTAATQSAGSSSVSSLTGGQALGKDAFLKLLVEQVRHQDPLKPMDDTAMVAQLAQFSTLEQQVTGNQLLQLLATQQRGLANDAAIGLVGKTASVRGNTVSLAGAGLGVPVRFSLAGPAQTVTVTLKDAAGRTVRTLELGAHAQGATSLSWDGKDDGGNDQPPGAYTVSVAAKTADGASVDVVQQTTGTVTSVSFDQGYAMIALDNGVQAPAADLVQVSGK